MPPVAVLDQVTRKTTCRAILKTVLNNAPGPQELGLFSGVADWPHIDEVFAGRSLSILASGGISTWYGMGGRRGYDGRLSFGAISSPALEIVQELADTFSGFQWTDDAGMTWAVRFAHDEGHDPDRSASALTYRGCVWVIDSKRRRPALNALRAQVARCSQPARSWDDADRARYGSLTRALHRLRLVDGAEQILGHIQHHAEVERAGHVLLTAEELGSMVNLTDQEAPRVLTVNELSAMLRATMGFEIAQLQLGSLGWNPRVIRQSAAVSEVEMIGSEAFRVRVSPLFSEVAAAFTQAVKPREMRHFQWRTTRIVAAPTTLIDQERLWV